MLCANFSTDLTTKNGCSGRIRFSEICVLSGNGSLDYGEFCAIFKDTLLTKVDAMKNIFDEIDENGDGKIQDTELQQAMTKVVGEPVELEEAQCVITIVDRDGDGHISFDGKKT